jgi:hypothetical protein
MEKLVTKDRTTKGKSHLYSYNCVRIIEGLKISNSQVKRLERELKNLKEEVRNKGY